MKTALKQTAATILLCALSLLPASAGIMDKDVRFYQATWIMGEYDHDEQYFFQPPTTGTAFFLWDNNAASSDRKTTPGMFGSEFTLTSGTVNIINATTSVAGKMSAADKTKLDGLSAPVAPTYNNNVSRTLNSNYTISTTQNARCSYSISVSWTLQALLTGSGSAFLEYSTNSGSTWTTVSNAGKSLALLTFAGGDDMNLSGEVPANALTRIRTAATNMTITYTRGQEVLQ